MSIASDSRFAWSAAVLSMARTTMRENAGGLPHHCGLRVSTTYDPATTSETT
jgi:hypothetical protein